MMRLILLICSVLISFISTNPVLGDNLSKEEIKIGFIIPLTGGQAPSGEDMMRTAKLLEAKFTAKSSKYSYKFIIDDGKCGQGNAPTTIASKYINLDKIRFLVTGCSGETLQVGPIAQRSGVVLFAVMANHKEVKHLGDYIFRTMYDIEVDMDKFANYLEQDLQGKKIAMLTEENTFTSGMSEILKRRLGDRVVYAEDFTPDTGDFRTLLAKVKISTAKGVYFAIISDRTLATLVNQARELNIPQKLYSYGSMPQSKYFLTATGTNSNGLEFLSHPDIKDSSNNFKETLNEYLTLYPDGPSFEFIIRTTHDALQSITDAIETVGPNPMAVKEFLKTYSSFGGLGKIEYDQNGDIKNVHTVIKRIEQGKPVLIDDLE